MSINQHSGNSKFVSSNQQDIHTDLESLVLKHIKNPDQRPISSEQQRQFEIAWNWHQTNYSNQSFILDTGCGTGASSQLLARQNPQSLVIGIDQSESRLGDIKQKQKSFDNLLLIQARMEEFWLQCLKAKWFPEYQYLLYPNPWPKKKHIQRRWHGHAIFPIILQVCDNLELRTNWQLYAREFSRALEITGTNSKIHTFKPIHCLTPFEQKYLSSVHNLFSVTTKKLLPFKVSGLTS